MTAPREHACTPVPALTRRAMALACAMAVAPVLAQQAGGSPRLQVTPTLSISETITDSRRDGSGVDRADAITTVSPGVRITSRAGRIQGNVDYSLAATAYARDSSSNDVQHQLAASVRAEAVQDHFYVDLRGSVARQPISALGVLSSDPTLASSNYSQVKTFSVAPVLTGRVAGLVDLRASLLLSTTDSGTGSISDSDTGTATLSLASGIGGTRAGWGLDLSRRIVDFERGRRTEEDRLIGSLSYAFGPELRVDVRAGIEEGNVASLTRERTNTWGGGFLWSPTTRTRLSGSADRRSFGHSHAFEFQHRMRRLVWRVGDRQDVTSGADATGASVQAYDLFDALFLSQEPDPVQRDLIVRSLLERNSLTASDLVNGGFLTGSSAVQRRQEVSLAYEGLRTTLLVSAFSTDSRRAFDLVTGVDDLSTGNLQQRGFTFSVGHRLTPTAALSLGASTSRSKSGGSGQTGRLNSITANWSDQLSRRSSLSIGMRHSNFDGSADSTDENALLANLRMTF